MASVTGRSGRCSGEGVAEQAKVASMAGFVPCYGARWTVRGAGKKQICGPRRSCAPAGRVSMVAAFGTHRWEIGADIDPEWQYEYLIDVPENLHDITLFDIDMRRFELSQLKGRVVFVINVATDDEKAEAMFARLQNLHERYSSRGLAILACPCNEFDQREPGSHEEIKLDHEKRGSEYYIMAKSFLESNPVFCLGHKGFPGEILWNFHGMFIFDRDGNPANRVPADAPGDLIEVKIQEVLERNIQS